MELNDNRITLDEFEQDFPRGIPVRLLIEVQNAGTPREARNLVNDHLKHVVIDDAATTVYGRLVWKHMEAARAGDDAWRAEIFELIEAFENLFPAECQVWKDRYSVTPA